MDSETQETSPIPHVFISYSHDSREHKQWVAKLASALRNKRVEVIFDQWDLEPGDDVPKFMERAVKRADRVLMICSEPYVRKVNDGKGGAGYEAMIVSGELVQDLGMRKFIPVIRQEGGCSSVPDCVSTRYYLDFSDDSEFDEVLGRLIETVYQVISQMKPPLGPHPFAYLSSPSQEALDRELVAESSFPSAISDPLAVYEMASKFARSGDMVSWRRLTRSVERQSALNLISWRETCANVPIFDEKNTLQIYEHATKGIDCYKPFFAIILAGIESRQTDFNVQLGWIDEVASPAGWKHEGLTYWCDFPELLIFIGQALVGAMLMETGSVQKAYDLALTRAPKRWRSNDVVPLFLDTKITGWPDSMNHTCTIAWGLLLRQFDDPWIEVAFGSSEYAKSALAAYYQFISFLNFCYVSGKGKFESGDTTWAITVPLNFCRFNRVTAMRGFRKFISEREVLAGILKENGLDNQERFSSHWENWMKLCGQWLGSVFNGYFDFEVPQRHLPKDLTSKRLALRDL